MSSSMRGMPLLSGPLPDASLRDRDERSDMSCRKCNKEFNVLFTRGRRCQHCSESPLLGDHASLQLESVLWWMPMVVWPKADYRIYIGYTYCNSCSDYQALMPRIGLDSGYDRVPVCAFCIQYLQSKRPSDAFLALTLIGCHSFNAH